MFVYNPAVILQGSPGEIILAVIISLIGVALISWGIGGYFLTRENLPQQLLLLTAGIMFITMETQTIIVGLILGTVVAAWQIKTVLQRRAALKQPPI